MDRSNSICNKDFDDRKLCFYYQFLKRLSQSDCGWILDQENRIRNMYCDCPWTFLGCGEVFRGGINITLQIFTAADNDSGCNQGIRQDLLRACKLEEPTK